MHNGYWQVFFLVKWKIDGICWTSERSMYQAPKYLNLGYLTLGFSGWASSWIDPLSPWTVWWADLSWGPTRWTNIYKQHTLPRYRHSVHGCRCTVQPPPFGIAPITAKRDVIHKTSCTLRSPTPPEEDRAMATGDLHTKFCAERFQRYARWQTDRPIDRRVDHNTPHPYWGIVITRYVIEQFDNLPSYPPDNHHHSNVVYWSEVVDKAGTLWYYTKLLPVLYCAWLLIQSFQFIWVVTGLRCPAARLTSRR